MGIKYRDQKQRKGKKSKRGREGIERIEEKKENKEREKNKDKNNFLHNIYKSVQPLTFYSGINLKPETILLFLGIVETCSMGSFKRRKKK